ncbi:hypothetical protein ACWCRD_41100 [Streptomyces sp. NPDC002092]
MTERHFTLIVLDRGNATGESTTVRDALVHSTGCRLIGTVPYATGLGSSRFELSTPSLKAVRRPKSWSSRRPPTSSTVTLVSPP